MKITAYRPTIATGIPTEVMRLDYVSSVDGTADWALVWPGVNPALWLIVIHGHGSHGDQLYTRPEMRDRWLPGFRASGAGILAVNLRDNAWMNPAAAADLHELIDWLRCEHDLNQTVLVSGSMGGTSNLIYAVLHPEDVNGVIARGAASDPASYYHWCQRQSAPIIQEIGAAIRLAYGGTPEEQPEGYRRHSALANADKLTMPVFLSHGGADEIIPVEQSRRLVTAMAGQSHFHYREILEGNHDSPLSENESFPAILKLI